MARQFGRRQDKSCHHPPGGSLRCDSAQRRSFRLEPDRQLAGDADLRGANMSKCDLSSVRMNRADVEGCRLDGAVLGCQYSRRRFRQANTTTLDLSGSHIGRRFGGIDDADRRCGQNRTSAGSKLREPGRARRLHRHRPFRHGLSGRNLNPVFVCARLRSVQFSRTILDLADFTEADLTAAKR